MAPSSRPDRFLFPVDDESSLCEHIDCLLPPPPSSPDGFRPSSIANASLLASDALAVLLAVLLALLIFRRRRRRRREAADAAAAAVGHLAALGDAVEVDNHVWDIGTAGLDESTIAGIATWAYKADDERVLRVSPAECTFCLSEFSDGDILRMLPECGHVFHRSCVDTWLRSHANCPLCRAPVVAPSSTPGGTDPGPSTSYPSAELGVPCPV